MTKFAKYNPIIDGRERDLSRGGFILLSGPLNCGPVPIAQTGSRLIGSLAKFE